LRESPRANPIRRIAIVRMFWQSNSAEKRLVSEELLGDELVMFAMRNVSLLVRSRILLIII
jgi:hypothetical protein